MLRTVGSKNTPTFFINGDRYDGPWDLDSLLSTLDEEVYLVGDKQTNSSIYSGKSWMI